MRDRRYRGRFVSSDGEEAKWLYLFVGADKFITLQYRTV